ncbi:hypothetical protein FNX48_014155, partial [Streptomyces sp. IF17]|nr:hypothetical protein [Streptomyces alkaliphilus]
MTGTGDTGGGVASRPLSGSGIALHRTYDTALLDLDGVVYTGGEAVPHAVEALAAARAEGMASAYVTNNASRTPATVADHLTRLGVAAEPEEVVTSAQAVARLIAEAVPAGARVLCAGGEGLRVALRERGLVPVESADEDPAAVVQGYGGPEMPWGRLVEAALAVNRGVPWFASNLDATIPTPRGVAPGNGAAVEVVRIASGGTRRPTAAGKPLPPMHRPDPATGSPARRAPSAPNAGPSSTNGARTVPGQRPPAPEHLRGRPARSHHGRRRRGKRLNGSDASPATGLPRRHHGSGARRPLGPRREAQPVERVRRRGNPPPAPRGIHR